MSRIRSLVALVALLAVLAAACGGDDDDGGSAGGNGGGDAKDLAAQCPVGAIAKSGKKPVEITFWHSMTSNNLETLTALSNRFNSSQDEVRVKLVNQTSYEDTLTKYRAALGGGQLPDLVQIQDVDARLVVDSQSILPAAACIEATKFDIEDVPDRIVSYYTLDNVLQAIPFSTSNPILYFNKKAFAKAGLDPAKPPTTLAELRAAAEKIKAAGYPFGLSLKQDAWYPEEWLAMSGELYADQGNGRDGRATKVLFDGAAGQEIVQWMSGMAKDGLAQLTDPNNFDNLLSLGSDVAGMTMDTSAALGTIVAVLGSGQYPNVDLGAALLPGPKGTGSTVQAGSANYIVNKSTPEKQEAAWKFASWLTLPEQTAEWSKGTGYIPVREAAVEQPVIKDLWAQQPFFRLAYDQITKGEDTDATAGPMIGDMEKVRDYVENALNAIFKGGDPVAIWKKAAADATAAIQDYESRIGG
jgi:sn-glycerol 3-phosphate transport system substrate-binding protein